MLKKQRESSRLGSLIQPYLIARNTYFYAIKKAKRDYWNQFLEKEDPQSIYKAMAYTKDRRVEKIPPIQTSLGTTEVGTTEVSPTLVDSFQEKCSTFRSILFPPPLQASKPTQDKYRPNSDQKQPKLTKDELDLAYSTT